LNPEWKRRSENNVEETDRRQQNGGKSKSESICTSSERVSGEGNI
jgi:hypothetical protein